MYSEVGQAIYAVQGLVGVPQFVHDNRLANVVQFHPIEVKKIEQQLSDIFLPLLLLFCELKYREMYLQESDHHEGNSIASNPTFVGVAQIVALDQSFDGEDKRPQERLSLHECLDGFGAF